jgi:hypothetical protein
MPGQSPSSTANNTSSTTNNTSVGDVGVTGQNAVDILNSLTNAASWGTFYGMNQGIAYANAGASVGNNFAGTGAAFGNSLALYGANTGYGFAQQGTALAQSGFDFAGNLTGQGFQFGSNTIQSNLAFADNVNARATDTLSGLINATRDVSSRILNNSTGQATPLQSLPAASSNVAGLASTSNTKWILLAVGGVVAFMIWKG